MPDLDVTDVGANRLLTSGAQPTHLQFGSVTLPRDQWARRSVVPGAFLTLPIEAAIISTQLRMSGADEDDSRAYTNFAALGVWIGDPADGASVLMAFGTAPDGQTYGAKELGIDLEVSANVILTQQQMGNITFEQSVVLNASESRFGLTRLPTQAEARALNGHRHDRVLTVLRGWEQIAAWYEARKASAQQALAGNNDDVLMSALRTRQAIDARVPQLDIAAARITGLLPVDHLRVFTADAGTVFPTNPAPVNGQNFIFTSAVAAGLTWRDTDGVRALTAAAKGDWARYNSAIRRWVKQVRQSSDVFLVPE